MSGATGKIGIGTRLIFDGEIMKIVEWDIASSQSAVVLRDGRGQMRRAALADILGQGRGRIITGGSGPDSTDERDPATVVLASLGERDRALVRERCAHVREVLTGFRSGDAETAQAGEPRESYKPDLPLLSRYQAKATELGVTSRTIASWVSRYRSDGPAGLAPGAAAPSRNPLGRVDDRWTEMAIDVMAEYQQASKPSRTNVVERTRARILIKYGLDVVPIPSRPTAFRALIELERRYPTFRLSSKRNRDIADRPDQMYGKLRPTRPGQYLLMDTTRLDVFALDPVTLRWVQVEMTIAMDWYTRCITGLRLTPVSTKSVDAAAVLYQTYRPQRPGKNWPPEAVWPEHGVPRSVFVDIDAMEQHQAGASGPAIVPETLVVDHGKIYMSEHLSSVCQRMGLSIQPARLRTGRDKGPVERFFRTVREDLLQVLPGYKGPDLYSRGLDVESEAFFYLDELESIIREWIAVAYHRRPHSSLVDPHVPGLKMSPVQTFEHGIARAGYIEAPRDPDLAYEFLATEWRTIQHYGVEIGGRRYNGNALNPYRNSTSPYGGKAQGRWPFQIDPDNINKIYFRDPESRIWHELTWEHAPNKDMPLSEDALRYARKQAAAKYRHSDDRLAVADLLERWNLGLGTSLAERRIALRQSRQDNLNLKGKRDAATELPSVAHALGQSPDAESQCPPGDHDEPDSKESPRPVEPIGGDDDAEEAENSDATGTDLWDDV